MILADTSVWIDNLRNGNHHLSALLYDERTIIHPFVIGELALGNLHDRDAYCTTLRGCRGFRLRPRTRHSSLLKGGSWLVEA